MLYRCESVSPATKFYKHVVFYFCKILDIEKGVMEFIDIRNFRIYLLYIYCEKPSKWKSIFCCCSY